MPVLLQSLRTPIICVLLSGLLVGVFSLGEPTLWAAEPSTATGQEPPAVIPDPSSGSGKEREGKGNHAMKKACAEDVKKLCSGIKPGEGRILQCLKQHAQDLSQGCTDTMQQRGKHRQ